MIECALKYDKASNSFVPYDFIQAEIIANELKDGEIYLAKVGRITGAKKRTLVQNNAIYLFCDKYAKALNDAGWEMIKTLDFMRKKKIGFEIPWRKQSFKENIWDRIMIAATGKDSTTKLETHEVNLVAEPLIRFMSQNYGVNVSFPDEYLRGLDEN